MASFERGSALVIQVEFKRLTPFGTSAYFDPSPAPKITVTDRNGIKKADALDMTRSATGKWYYLLQTATTWLEGDYSALVTAVDGSYSDVAVDAQAFVLT